MHIRPFCSSLYLPLLAFLWTSVAAAFEGPANHTVTGGVPLGVSPGSIPTFLIDQQQLDQSLCTVIDPEREILTGKCKAKTLNTPPPTPGMKMLDTTCGVWDASWAAIDRPIVRPGSEMVLRQATDDPGHGVFAGELDMNAHVRFTNRETGRTVDVKLRFGFTLEGPWVLADPDEPLTAENLILLAERDEEGQIMAREQCVEPDDTDEDCRICLRPDLWKVPVSL